MKAVEAGRIGRVVVFSFAMGDMLLEELEEGLKDQGIRNGVVISGIGTLKRARIHRVTTTGLPPVEEFPEIVEPIELSSVQGAIFDGRPHLHCTFTGLGDARTWSGHLETGCEVLYLAEIVVGELEGPPLARKRDENGLVVL